MAHRSIKLLPVFTFSLLMGFQADHDYQEGFTSKISHTSFFYEKSGWSKVYTFKPISIVYQPKEQLMIMKRLKIPDTLHMFPLSKAEQDRITKEYGDFRFLGAFSDHKLPPEFSHLMYVNPANLDVLQINRITIDAKGTEKIMDAILYMKDSINYMKTNRLFAK